MAEAEGKKEIVKLAEKLYEQFEKGDIPEVSFPKRTKSNIEYDEKSNVWIHGSSETVRSLNSKDGAEKLLKLSYLIEFLFSQLNQGRSSTLRELYYLSEGWEKAKFKNQDESNSLIEDLELLTSLEREKFNLRPEEDGATVIGPLKIKEKTSMGKKVIDCQDDVGEAGYKIPSDVTSLEFLDVRADFAIAVETGGMRDRLVENGFDIDFNSVIIHLKGQPARSTRRIIKRLNEEKNLPVVVFTDGDPWSFRIYASVSYGSINLAHLSKKIATPDAYFLGVEPRDIVEYSLPTETLSDTDRRALENELEDPRFKSEYWQNQIELQLDLGEKAEQQALASRGLDFVTEEYLPKKLEKLNFNNQ